MAAVSDDEKKSFLTSAPEKPPESFQNLSLSSKWAKVLCTPTLSPPCMSCRHSNKVFFFAIDTRTRQACVFAISRHFQPSLISVSKAEDYPIQVLHSENRLPACQVNIRLIILKHPSLFCSINQYNKRQVHNIGPYFLKTNRWWRKLGKPLIWLYLLLETWILCYKTVRPLIYEFSLSARVFVPGRPFLLSLIFVGRLQPYSQTLD